MFIFCSTVFALHALTFPMNFSLGQQDQQRQAQSNKSENVSAEAQPRKPSLKSDEQRQLEADINKGSSAEPSRETSKNEGGAYQEVARKKEAMDPSERKLEQNEPLGGEPVRETTK